MRVYPSETGNGVPVVDPGSSRCVWLSQPTVALSGSVWNASASATPHWSQTLGPAPVAFTSPNSLATTASFTAPGVYTLRLTVTDGAAVGYGNVYVTVYDNNAPTTNGGGSGGGSFGYTADQLQANFTGDLDLEYDFTGFDWQRFKPAPAVGIHPRLLFNPEDVPDLRSRLTTTATGQYFMTEIREMIQAELYGQKPAALPFSVTVGKYTSVYNDLANGSSASFAALSSADQDTMMADMTYECFRVLIDDDHTQAAANAAMAMATACAGVVTPSIQAAIATQPPGYIDYRDVVQPLIHRQYIAYAYDFIFNYATPAQQDAIRRSLLLATTNMWTIGLDSVPAVYANASNWIPIHTLHLTMDSLAVEGETDSFGDAWDPALYPRLVSAMQRFMTMGCYKDGSFYEGMGKGTVNSEMYIPMAKHGDYLLAELATREHVRTFYMRCMVPWGANTSGQQVFEWDEDIGALGSAKYVDVAVPKYAFPNDPLNDFVFRNDETESLAGQFWDFNRRFAFKSMDFLLRAVCAQDYDHSQTWTQENQSALGSLPLTYFSKDRGLLITRSDWTANALQLFFQPRSLQGGHSHADRNTFVFSALGRQWVPYNGVHYDLSDFGSTVRIDGVGVGILPAHPVELDDAAQSTFLAGDAAFSYDWLPGADLRPARHGDAQQRALRAVQHALLQHPGLGAARLVHVADGRRRQRADGEHPDAVQHGPARLPHGGHRARHEPVCRHHGRHPEGRLHAQLRVADAARRERHHWGAA